MANGFLARTLGGLLRDRTFQAGVGVGITNPAGDTGDPTFSINGGSLPIILTDYPSDLEYVEQLSNLPLKMAFTDANNGFTGANSFANNAIDLQIGQIKFPATFNPSANPNTLDDYEEGTYTPHLEFGGASAGITYNLQVGFYVKIGTLLCYSGRIDLSSKGISAGAATITPTPFAEVDGAANGGNFSYYSGFAAAVVAPQWNMTSQTMNLTYSGAGGVVGLANTDFTNASVLIWSGWYRT